MIYEEALSEVYFMTRDTSNMKIQKVWLDPKKAVDNPV